MPYPYQSLLDIARQHLLIPTLNPRRADSLNFHIVTGRQVEAALKAAFRAGRRFADKTSERAPVGKPAASPTTLLVGEGTPLVPGKMYLRLYHGRTNPDQEMDDWGFDGPTFGPLSGYVHTYCSNFRCYAECGTDEIWLETNGDMICWDDCYYGDMEVFIAEPNNKA